MADGNVEGLTALTAANAVDTDLIYIWDIGESGIARSKKMTVGEVRKLGGEVLMIAISDETTDLTTGTAKTTFRMPYAMTLSEVRASVTTAGTTGTTIFDINDGGTSIMTTNKLDILTTATIDDGTATLTDTALADKAIITIDIDAVSTTAPKGAKIYLIGTRT